MRTWLKLKLILHTDLLNLFLEGEAVLFSPVISGIRQCVWYGLGAWAVGSTWAV